MSSQIRVVALVAQFACSSGSSDPGRNSRPGPAWPGKAIHLDLGRTNTCAVASNGAGYCWGSNANLQTTWPHDGGDPCASGASGADGWPCLASLPVPITGGVNWKSLWYGSDGPLCGVDQAGAVSCYSYFVPADNFVDYPLDVTTDAHNQPLCGGIACYLMPLKVKGGGAWTYFRWGAGFNVGCGLHSDGSAFCVGGNGQYGQLGSGNTIGEIIKTPRAVSGSHTFTQLSVAWSGNHACAIAADQTAWCWGESDQGALGGNTNVPNKFPQGVPYPIQVSSAAKFTSITAGSRYACALDTAGKAHCWGTTNAGAFGNGSGSGDVGGMTLTTIEAGLETTCGIDPAGDGWCWGQNNRGQLGIGTVNASTAIPTKVSGGLKWKTIVPGSEHTCGIASDDSVWCWGANSAGQLGASSQWVVNAGADSNIPVAVGK